MADLSCICSFNTRPPKTDLTGLSRLINSDHATKIHSGLMAMEIWIRNYSWLHLLFYRT
jgi:hypothetical protein